MMQEFVQALKNSTQEALDDVHTAIPGEIISFDPASCTAKVQLIGKFKKPDGKKLDYPPVANVPICFMQASNQESCICFPIKPGDGCLALFSEQSLEAWRTGGETLFDLKHDLTNAIAIMGTCRKPNPLMQEASDQDALLIRQKDAKVKLSNEEVFIKRGDSQSITMAEASIALKQGGTTFTLDGSGGRLVGNLEVMGNILSSGNMTANGDVSAAGNMAYGGTITGSRCP